VADSDDLLSADEIEAMMQAARSGTPASPPPAAAAPSKPADSHLLDPNEIEELMAQARASKPAPARKAPAVPSDALSAADIEALINGGGAIPARADQTLQQAQHHLDQALGTQPLRGPKAPPPELGTPLPFGFPDLSGRSSEPAAPVFPIAALEDVELDLRIELGRTELLIEEVLQLREGTVVPLDKLAGDPVDILVNGRLIARGEVLVLNDNFCVRVAEILTPEL
jgi:flagellar motor switch protein FliN/FliY